MHNWCEFSTQGTSGLFQITLAYPTISGEYWEIRWAYRRGGEVGYDRWSGRLRLMIRSAMTGDQLTVSRLLATTKQYSRIRIAVFLLWDCSILLFGLQYSLMRTKKIPHLSHFLWKRLYIKGKEHGRDVFDLSHISPFNPHATRSGTTL